MFLFLPWPFLLFKHQIRPSLSQEEVKIASSREKESFQMFESSSLGGRKRTQTRKILGKESWTNPGKEQRHCQESERGACTSLHRLSSGEEARPQKRNGDRGNVWETCMSHRPVTVWEFNSEPSTLKTGTEGPCGKAGPHGLLQWGSLQWSELNSA